MQTVLGTGMGMNVIAHERLQFMRTLTSSRAAGTLDSDYLKY